MVLLTERCDTVTIEQQNETGTVSVSGAVRPFGDPRAYMPYVRAQHLRQWATSGGGETVAGGQDLVGHVQQSLLRLQRFAALAPNWDSYGAQPISTRAIRLASELLITVAEEYGPVAGDRVRPYAVAPLASGGVQIEWRRPGAELEIEIDAIGELGYLYAKDHDGQQLFTEKDKVSRSEVLDLVSAVVIP